MTLARAHNRDTVPLNCSKKVFGDISDRKVAFLDYKSIDIKKLQSLQSQKSMISPWFLFGQKFQKKVFGHILDRKIAFLHYKNIQDFGQKLENFPSFLFCLKVFGDVL